MIYDSKHSFYKYRLSEFNKISSIDSKFDIIGKCYKDFISLTDADAEPGCIEQRLYWTKCQNFMMIWLKSSKTFTKESLKMIKVIAGSKNRPPKFESLRLSIC